MSDSRLARWLLGAAGIAAALAIGRWTAEPPAPAREAPPPTFQMTSADRAAIRNEIRTAVAAAVPANPRVAPAAGGAVTVLDSPEPTADELAPEPTPEMRAADAAARKLVDDAVARRTWSAADWRALEDLAGQLAPEQRLEAFQRLAVAINNQQLASLAPPVAGP